MSGIKKNIIDKYQRNIKHIPKSVGTMSNNTIAELKINVTVSLCNILCFQ